MGMFDYVNVKMKLPGSWRPGKDELAQTKSLGRDLYRYTINEDGVVSVVKFEVDEEPQYSEPQSCRDLVVGKFNFYYSPDNPPRWYEYESEIVYGVLSKVRKVSPPNPEEEYDEE